MQENILEANHEVELDVYVIWEPTLGASRNRAVGATELMPDSRVRHYWNDAFIVGEYFREHAFDRTAWDIYFLYGSEATWEDNPEPLIISGYTVIRERSALEAELLSLWKTELSTAPK